MTDKPHIQYFNMGPWPVYVGCTTSPKAFKREMKRLNVPNPPPFTSADASTHTFDADDKPLTIIITMQPGDHSPEQIAGLLAHEATHAVQFLWERIGEHKPGKEAEAYLVQMITQCCMQVVLKTGRTRKFVP